MIAASVAIVLVVLLARLTEPLKSTRQADPIPQDGLVRRLGMTFRRDLKRRRHEPDAALWAEALSRLSRAVRSGHTLRAAFAELQPWPPQTGFDRIAALIDAGEKLDVAVGAVVGSSAADEVIVRATLRACAQFGGQMAGALDQASATLRERATAIEERRVFASQARLSGQVLSILPLGVAGWMVATDERSRALWFGGPLGACLLAGGISLNAAGWMWMRRLVVVR